MARPTVKKPNDFTLEQYESAKEALVLGFKEAADFLNESLLFPDLENFDCSVEEDRVLLRYAVKVIKKMETDNAQEFMPVGEFLGVRFEEESSDG
jgi:hypothetical protein